MEYKPGSRIQAEHRPCGRGLELPNTSNEGRVPTNFFFYSGLAYRPHVSRENGQQSL